MAGGQARYSSRIENFPGFPIGVTGEALTKNMFDQSKRLGAEQMLGVRVTNLDYDESTGLKRLTLSNGTQIDSRSVILAGGVEFRTPTFPGAEGPGVIVGDGKALAAQCVGTDATVTGGSNGAAQAALGAAVNANHVYLVSRSPITKGMSDYQVAAVRNNPKITVLENESVTRVHRDSAGNITGVETTSGKKLSSKVLGVFLGSVPETNWLGGKVNRDKSGRISTNTRLETSIPGVFAVGDMREGAIGRVGVAVGEGQLALREAHVYLESFIRKSTTTDAMPDTSTYDLISDLFDLDRANPYFGSTIEGVKPGRSKKSAHDAGPEDEPRDDHGRWTRSSAGSREDRRRAKLGVAHSAATAKSVKEWASSPGVAKEIGAAIVSYGLVHSIGIGQAVASEAVAHALTTTMPHLEHLLHSGGTVTQIAATAAAAYVVDKGLHYLAHRMKGTVPQAHAALLHVGKHLSAYYHTLAKDAYGDSDDPVLASLQNLVTFLQTNSPEQIAALAAK